MNVFILSILIVCAFGLYGVKCLVESYQKGPLVKVLEKAARKALRFTLMGIGVVGVACLALILFPLIRFIGFSLLSGAMIDFIRILLEALFDTQSVYAAIQILASLALFAAEFSLLFSLLGFCVVRMLTFFHLVECSSMEQQTKPRGASDVAIPRAFRKIFLNFANLRI